MRMCWDTWHAVAQEFCAFLCPIFLQCLHGNAILYLQQTSLVCVALRTLLSTSPATFRHHSLTPAQQILPYLIHICMGNSHSVSSISCSTC
jgi:hypothetical protein